MTSTELDRAVSAVAALADVLPGEASQEVEAVYADTRATLRVPVVNFVFRTAANEPAWLVCAWGAVRPVAATVPFERAADALREHAAGNPPSRDPDALQALGGDADEVRAYVATIQYVLPKLLLIASGWQAALESPTAAAGGVTAVGDPLPSGEAPGTVNVPMVDPDQADKPVRGLLEDIADRHGHPAPATFYRGLANWPDFLARVWAQLRDQVESAAYRELRAQVIADAQQHANNLGLDARVECGCPRPDWPGIVSVFRLLLLPDLMIVSAAVRAMLEGREGAGRSAFSLG